MALKDWDVTIVDIVPKKNNQPNLLGQPLDPQGKLDSIFKVRVTHKTITDENGDPYFVELVGVSGWPSLGPDADPIEAVKAWIVGFAQSAIPTVERHLVVQTRPGRPSPLKDAVVDVIPPTPPEKVETDDDKAIAAFIVLVRRLVSARTRLAQLQRSKSAKEETDAATEAVTAAEVAVKEAYSPKGAPVSEELAARFDDIYATMTANAPQATAAEAATGTPAADNGAKK